MSLTCLLFALFSLSDGTLGHDILCVSARQEGSDNDNHVELGPCDNEDYWDYDPRLAQLQHQPSGQCLKVRLKIRMVIIWDWDLGLTKLHNNVSR